MDKQKEKTVIIIPENFSMSETKILSSLISAINRKHQEIMHNYTFDFSPLKDDRGHCRFLMTSDLRPYKLLQVEADTFSEAVGKMYVIIEEQLP